MGYLNSDMISHVLSSEEFSLLLEKLDPDFFAAPWTNHEIIQKFGTPSIRWGTNDNYPCIFLYIDNNTPARYCYFDFWAEFYIDESGCSVPQKYGPYPRLRNIRRPAKTFVGQFQFTEFGLGLATEE